MTRGKTYLPEGWLYDTPENRAAIATPSALKESMANNEILEAPVLLCDAEHNLIVKLGCMKGVIPRTEGAIGIKEGTVRDIALISRVGKPVSFVIKQICTDRLGRLYALLSRREAQLMAKRYILKNMSVGSVIPARVTHLESFGAFCDIGCGVIALLPIDSISVSRIAHPKDRFSVGDDVKAVIKSIDSDNRITLTHKELLGTWEENAECFCEGQTVSGIIRSVESYGVFIELAPNLAGLAEPKPNAFAGMRASVYVKSIMKEKMKIKLIIIDCFENDTKEPIHYFFEGNQIKHWQYSPENCTKNIYTDFLQQ